MAPSAVTPPPQDVNGFPPTDKLNTTRKIVVFSGKFCLVARFGVNKHLTSISRLRRHHLHGGHRPCAFQQIRLRLRTARTTREAIQGPLDLPFDTGLKAIQEALTLDLDFKTFHQFCINNNIPFNVISAGLKPILRRVLDHFLGDEQSAKIEIIANDATIDGEGHEWKPQWRHETDTGHDKALSINEYKDAAKIESEDGTIPMVIFVGDGVSDLAAASEADVLFARRGLALEEHCKEHGIKYYPYDTFADVQREIIRIAKIDEKKTKGEGLPINFNPRANMWRRLSSKTAVPVLAAQTPLEAAPFIWPEQFDAALAGPEQYEEAEKVAAGNAQTV
jgi:2-hydroxy-3-keto-5-methylthiopentenyl-1-phosphate phosphatase